MPSAYTAPAAGHINAITFRRPPFTERPSSSIGNLRFGRGIGFVKVRSPYRVLEKRGVLGLDIAPLSVRGASSVKDAPTPQPLARNVLDELIAGVVYVEPSGSFSLDPAGRQATAAPTAPQNIHEDRVERELHATWPRLRSLTQGPALIDADQATVACVHGLTARRRPTGGCGRLAFLRRGFGPQARQRVAS